MERQPCTPKYIELSLLFSTGVHTCMYIFVGKKTQTMSHPTNTARKVILKTVFMIIIFIFLIPFNCEKKSACEETLFLGGN
jgi:hypothetical protein